MIVRQVKAEDAAQIAEIYNYYILNTHHTFETEALSAEEMEQRIAEISEDYFYLVAELDNELLGYLYATQFKLRQAYKHSLEVSIYVRHNAKQSGVGSKLYEELLKNIEETDAHTLVAGISLPNEASIKFHEKIGYRKAAHFREIGYKLGRWIDVGYWEMTL